jgi:hypothetical protein
MKWVPGLSRGYEFVELYVHSPIRLHGYVSMAWQLVTHRDFTFTFTFTLYNPEVHKNQSLSQLNPGYIFITCFLKTQFNKRVYPKVSGLVSWSENCK